MKLVELWTLGISEEVLAPYGYKGSLRARPESICMSLQRVKNKSSDKYELPTVIF